jgi:hypothetical protein
MDVGEGTVEDEVEVEVEVEACAESGRYEAWEGNAIRA